ncbi:MAG: hypothetical protein IJ759_01340 [Bacteroidales bacterium]|nr:hypothetical protein [Bacteroidales bacterium]
MNAETQNAITAVINPIIVFFIVDLPAAISNDNIKPSAINTVLTTKNNAKAEVGGVKNNPAKTNSAIIPADAE